MSLFKTLLLSNQAKVVFKTQNPLHKTFLHSLSFIIRRTLSSSPQEPIKKPLSLLFEEAVGLTEKAGGNESEYQEEKNGIMSELRELEREVRALKENPKSKVQKEEKEKKPKKKVINLVELFGGEKMVEKRRRESGEATVLKDLSPFVKAFASHLYSKGYFNNANFLVDNKLDFSYFDSKYGRDFIKSAAYKFGKDHQEIAQWLSSKNLKTVALFGCPSLDKNNVFAAKWLRKIFKIQEDTVCSQCMLKDSCRHANKDVWGIAARNLLLVHVMKVIIVYNLDQVPPKLTVPDEVRDSANKLLEEVIKLSRTT